MATIETTADRYRRLTAAFADTIAAVPGDRWDSPSPCEGWTARDVVAHVIDAQGRFLQRLDIDPAPALAREGDLLIAFRAAAERMQSALDDPGLADAAIPGMGPVTLAGGVDQFITTDLLVHRWDLAQAAGIDVDVDPGDVEMVKANAARFPQERLRSPGVFGPAVEAPEEADDWQTVLAFLGRRA